MQDFGKNNLVRTFDKWGPYYKITLEIKLVQSLPRFHNLIHLTSGPAKHAYGSRIPFVLLRGKNLSVRITNYDNGLTDGGIGKLYISFVSNVSLLV